MSFLSLLAPIIGSIGGGLLGQSAQNSAESNAANLANTNTQNAFNAQTGYANTLRGQLGQQVNGFQNPFIQALSQLKAPNPSANTYQNVGMSGTPMFGGSGQPTGASYSGTPMGAAAGGTMAAPQSPMTGRGFGGTPAGGQNMFANLMRRPSQPMMRTAGAM